MGSRLSVCWPHTPEDTTQHRIRTNTHQSPPSTAPAATSAPAPANAPPPARQTAPPKAPAPATERPTAPPAPVAPARTTQPVPAPAAPMRSPPTATRTTFMAPMPSQVPPLARATPPATPPATPTQTTNNMLPAPAPALTIQCTICLEPTSHPLNLCGDKQHAGFCKDCWVQHITTTVTSMPVGSCTPVLCPSATHHTDKKRPIIPFTAWRSVVLPSTVATFCDHARALIRFRCGECHRHSDLDPGFIADAVTPRTTNALLPYLSGAISTDEMYRVVLTDLLPHLNAMKAQAAHRMFRHLATCIDDPERRVNLYLRFLRDRPCTWTQCCSTEHCFRCQTHPFHHGQTCTEIATNTDSDMVSCPACTTMITKGDGCNTMICMCGAQFNWSDEVRKQDSCARFKKHFPHGDTHMHCARVLLESDGTTSVMRDLAQAWRAAHTYAVERSMLCYLRTRFPFGTTYRVLALGSDLSTPLAEARNLWLQSHRDEWNRARAEQDLMKYAPFLAVVPRGSDTAATANVAARAVADMHRDIARSAQHWIDAHTTPVREEERHRALRRARQFLFMYGARPLHNVCSADTFAPHVKRWSLTLGDKVFLAQLPAAVCILRLEVKRTISTTSDWTVGIAWNAPPTTQSSLNTRTQNINARQLYRPLVCGDVLSVLVNVPAGKLTWFLNNNEQAMQQDLSFKCTHDRYMFNVTQNANIAFSLLPPPTGVAFVVLNEQQFEGCTCLRKVIADLLVTDRPSPHDKGWKARFGVSDSAWLSRWKGSAVQAHEQFTALRPLLATLAGTTVPPVTTPGPALELAQNDTTWNVMLEALAWFDAQKSPILQRVQMLAETFAATHGDDAAFMAAMLLHPPPDTPDSREHDVQLGLAAAFARAYPQKMDEWYTSDMKTREPLVPRVAIGCTCIPRHIRSCPLLHTSSSPSTFKAPVGQAQRPNTNMLRTMSGINMDIM